MGPIDQIIDSRGKVPVKAALCEAGKSIGDSRLVFVPCSPEENSLLGSTSNKSAAEDLSLEDIAFLYDAEGHLDRLHLEKVAKKAGPLFGAHEEEMILDWIALSSFAKDVLTIQEAVNGRHPFENLSSQESGASLIAKSRAKECGTVGQFVIYSYETQVGANINGDFIRTLPQFPIFAKSSVGDGFDYVFAQLEEVDGLAFVSTTLFSFKQEISVRVFAAVLSAVGIDFKRTSDTVSAISVLGESDITSGCGTSIPTGIDIEVCAEEDIVSKDDLPHLQKLISFLASLNLRKIVVDFFRADKDNGHMVFPNYASYLWYGFMQSRGQVKIGVCEICGKGFSLAGHRGVARRFCSDKCKTKAKNERTRHRRDQARMQFLSGKSVDDITRCLYAEELATTSLLKHKTFDEARSAVVGLLATYPEIKHMVSNDIHCGDGAFADRCFIEGVFSEKDFLHIRG